MDLRPQRFRLGSPSRDEGPVETSIDTQVALSSGGRSPVPVWSGSSVVDTRLGSNDPTGSVPGCRTPVRVYIGYPGTDVLLESLGSRESRTLVDTCLGSLVLVPLTCLCVPLEVLPHPAEGRESLVDHHPLLDFGGPYPSSPVAVTDLHVS